MCHINVYTHAIYTVYIVFISCIWPRGFYANGLDLYISDIFLTRVGQLKALFNIFFFTSQSEQICKLCLNIKSTHNSIFSSTRMKYRVFQQLPCENLNDKRKRITCLLLENIVFDLFSKNPLFSPRAWHKYLKLYFHRQRQSTKKQKLMLPLVVRACKTRWWSLRRRNW